MILSGAVTDSVGPNSFTFPVEEVSKKQPNLKMGNPTANHDRDILNDENGYAGTAAYSLTNNMLLDYIKIDSGRYGARGKVWSWKYGSDGSVSF